MRYFIQAIKWLGSDKLSSEQQNFKYLDEGHHVHHTYDERGMTLYFSFEETDENGSKFLVKESISFNEYYWKEFYKAAKKDFDVVERDYRDFKNKIVPDLQFSLNSLATAYLKLEINYSLPELLILLERLFDRCTLLFETKKPSLKKETRGNPNFLKNKISDEIFIEMIDKANKLLDENRTKYQPRKNTATSGTILKDLETQYDFKYKEKRIGDNFRERTSFDGSYFRLK